jgi:hypothetical protein
MNDSILRKVKMKKLLLILALLVAGSFFQSPSAKASGGACAAGCVQYGTGGAFSGNTISVTLTGVTAGNGVHAYVCFQGPTSIASATVGGNSATVSNNFSPTNKNTCGVVAYGNSPAGSVTITATLAGSACANCEMIAEEWNGDAHTSLLDGQNGGYVFAASPGSALAPGTFTTTHAQDVIEVVLFQVQNAEPTLPAGFTFAVDTTTTGPWYTAYELVSVAGAQNPTWTSGTNSFNNYVLGGGFAQIVLPPVNTGLPIITGSSPPVVAFALMSSTGTWTHFPTSYAFQWQSNGSNVGTNSNMYTPVSGDIGNTLTVTVTASNAGGAGIPATSAATLPVLAAAPVPKFAVYQLGR